MASDDSDPPSNVFVRFKQHVDAKVGAGFDVMLGGGASKKSGNQAPDQANGIRSPKASEDYMREVTESFKKDEASLQEPSRPDPMNEETLLAHRNLLSLAFSKEYSPSALTHIQPPRPRDLSSHLDAELFTMRDAYEDLLAVSLGKQMPPSDTKYQKAQTRQGLFGDASLGTEPHFAWLTRLLTDGLAMQPMQFDCYLRPLSSFEVRARPVQQEQLDSPQPGFDSFKFHAGQMNLELKTQSSHVAPTMLGFRIHAGDPDEDSDVYSETINVFKMLGMTNSLAPLAYSTGMMRALAKPALESEAEPGWPRRQPNHTDDLFADLAEMHKELTSAQSSWDTFMKQLRQDEEQRRPTQAQSQPQARQSGPWRNPETLQSPLSTRQYSGDHRRVETRTSYTDSDGNVHEEIRIKTFDDHDNEIGQETTHTVRSQKSFEWGTHNPAEEERNADKKGEQGPKKPGWFW